MNRDRITFPLSYEHLSPEQQALVKRSSSGDTRFLEGPAGTGKTTVGIARLTHLLNEGIPADDILVLAPQRTLLAPYQYALRGAERPPGGTVTTLTIAGLARRMVQLFWPLVAERAGFAHPENPPVFLTLETAQYYMARIADPLIEAGAFEEVTIDRNRLLSQILDNLNKAALVGLEYTQVGERLVQAWIGTSARAAVHERAQRCANEFRAYCLAHNLLDFSLQIEVFVKHLLTLPWPPGESFMTRFVRYRHLIVDNVEEDVPITHDMLRTWLPRCDSALLIYDHDAGYRVFLGADPDGALALRDVCRHSAELRDSFVITPHLHHLGYELARSFRQTPPPIPNDNGNLRQALVISETHLRFHPQMLDWVSEEIARLVGERAVPPEEIVVVAPFLSDALRFSLSERLDQAGVPTRSHRPSRALRDEPAARCLLTLAAIAYPEWGHAPLPTDVAHALALSIADLDLVRAQLLSRIVYRPQDVHTPSLTQPDETGTLRGGRPVLSPFAELNTSVQERIGYRVGNRYDALRDWLHQNRDGHVRPLGQPRSSGETKNGAPQELASSNGAAQGPYSRPRQPLDHFFSRIFGEVLSQPGYGFHSDLDAGRVIAQLIESALKFRQVVEGVQTDQFPYVGLDYVRMVERGVLAAQYVPAWGAAREEESAVLLAPAYTFLMRNRPVDYQFWLNPGSSGWWERLFQPLTHPYVLTRHWRHGEAWTDAHEVNARTQALYRLVQGLIRRCRVRVYLGTSARGEHGYEQRGPLLQAIQGALRRQGLRG